MAESKEVPAWTYEHPADHPDNNPPVTVVAVPSDEEKAKYEASINAELAKSQPQTLSKEAQAAGPQPKAEPVDYEAKTVDELKTMAHERGIDVAWDARKADLVKALEKDDKAKAK